VQGMNLGNAQLLHGIGVTTAVGDGRGATNLPAALMIRGNLKLALPGLLLTALASGVAQLNGR
jgi:hypothetical protein